MILAGSYWWMPALLRQMSFFDVRRVEVVGARFRDASALVAAMELPETSSVFADLEALEERLRRQGGVERVNVRRRLPGTLVVRIAEAEPVALTEGRTGLVPVDRSGRPLPYDVTTHPVDVPVVGRPEPRLAEALAQVRTMGGELYAAAGAAWIRGSGVTLDIGEGLVRLDAPVAEERLQSLLAVKRDLAARGFDWDELDGRFRGWIVVRPGRTPGTGNRESGIEN